MISMFEDGLRGGFLHSVGVWLGVGIVGLQLYYAVGLDVF